VKQSPLDTIREALEKAKDALDGSEINMNNYSEDEVSKLDQASTVAWWAIRDSLAAICSLSEETSEDAPIQKEAIVLEARKFARDLWRCDDHPGGLDWLYRAGDLIAADRERIRRETREECKLVAIL